MKEQVKVKTGGDAGEEQTERPAEPEGPQPRKNIQSVEKDTPEPKRMRF